MLNFQGVTYFFKGGITKKQDFRYVGTVLFAELNIYMYKKLLVPHHLTLSIDYETYFAYQLI